MEPEIKILLIVLASPVIMLAVHMLALRAARPRSQQVTAAKSLVLGYLPTALFLWFSALKEIRSVDRLIGAVVFSTVAYGCLALVYFHAFNMSETARRVRILYEIYSAGSLSAGEVTDLYKTSDIITLRLGRLVAMRQLKFAGGFYSMDGKLLYAVGALILWWRRLLRLNRNEVY